MTADVELDALRTATAMVRACVVVDVDTFQQLWEGADNRAEVLWALASVPSGMLGALQARGFDIDPADTLAEMLRLMARDAT